MVQSIFCFRLHTAAVIIGWSSAIAYIIMAIVDVVFLSNVDQFIKILNDTSNNSTEPIIPDLKPEDLRIAVYLALAVYLLLNVTNAFSSILLVAGAMKERHTYIVPWLLNNGVYVVFSVMNAIGWITFAIVHKASAGSIILLLIYVLLTTGLSVYIWCGMHSLYKLFRDASDRQRLINNPAGAPKTYPSYTRI